MRRRPSVGPGTRAASSLVPASLLLVGFASALGAQEPWPGLIQRSSCLRARIIEASAGSGTTSMTLHPALSLLLGTGAERGAGPSPSEDPWAPERGASLEVGLGGRWDDGYLRAGESRPSQDGFSYPGPMTVGTDRSIQGLVALQARWGRVGAVVDAIGGSELQVATATVGMRVGAVVVTAGREGLWPGISCSDGLVLSGRGRMDGVGVETDGLRIGGVGAIVFSVFAGSLRSASSTNRRPWFLAQRIGWSSNGGSWTLGLTRASLFGGDQTDVPVTPRTVGLMLLGVTDLPTKDSDFENQVASVDVGWRIPLSGGAWWLRGEYGADDSGFAFLHSPAVRVGVDAVFPGAEEARGLAGSLVWIAPSSRAYPEWYRHGALAWGWTDRGLPLGHALAGEGWGLDLQASALSRRRDVVLGLLVARRGDENLLAPQAGGWGLSLRAEGRRWIHEGGNGVLQGRGRVRLDRLGAHTGMALELFVSYVLGGATGASRLGS